MEPQVLIPEGSLPFSGVKLWGFSGDSSQHCNNEALATSNPLAVDCSNFKTRSLFFSFQLKSIVTLEKFNEPGRGSEGIMAGKALAKARLVGYDHGALWL